MCVQKATDGVWKGAMTALLPEGAAVEGAVVQWRDDGYHAGAVDMLDIPEICFARYAQSYPLMYFALASCLENVLTAVCGF